MYKCKKIGCHQEFKFTMQLARHDAKCKKPEPDRKYVVTGNGFRCGNCKKVFSHQPNVSRHVKNCQAKQKAVHKCLKCGKGFKYQSRLTAHLKTHSKTENKTCKCGKSFIRIDYYTSHVAICSTLMMLMIFGLPSYKVIQTNYNQQSLNHQRT